MRGIIGLVIITIILLFTGGGSWLWSRVKQLDGACYAAVQRAGVSQAGSLCDAMARGIASLDTTFSGIGAKMDAWKQGTFGGSSGIGSMTASIGNQLTSLASSNETLTRMIQAGPSNLGSSSRQSIQQAIDSFTIGQGYLKQGGSSEAVSWFQQGAAQPQGYGLMSQLQLGNLYMTGQGGVPQNNQAASAYLQQASDSITTLTQSNTPQSQQLLGTLPASPDRVKSQLESTIRQLRISR